jgi:hypothetical protein
MYAKPIILALLAACGFSTNPEPPDGPDDRAPPNGAQEAKHFCCTSVDQDKLTGEGCIGIPDDNAIINACSYVLFCSGDWTKADGHVVCDD